MESNIFASELTNGIYYTERTDNFKYTNVLNEKIYIHRLIFWLSNIHKSDFEFEPLDDNASEEEIKLYNETPNLFKFDDWWLQLENLKYIIKEHDKCLKFKFEK